MHLSMFLFISLNENAFKYIACKIAALLSRLYGVHHRANIWIIIIISWKDNKGYLPDITHFRHAFNVVYEMIFYGKYFNQKSNIKVFGNIFLSMMTSSNGNIFRVTGHLCGEFTGLRWIPRTKASDAELWCFLWSAPE